MTDVRDHLVDAVSTLATTPDKDRQQHETLRIMAMCWNMLPCSIRKRFLSKVDASEPYSFVRFEPVWPDASREINEAARYWPYVMPDLAGQDRDFAKTIFKQIRMRRPPSEKQAEWMLRLYREWKRYADTDGEVTE